MQMREQEAPPPQRLCKMCVSGTETQLADLASWPITTHLYQRLGTTDRSDSWEGVTYRQNQGTVERPSLQDENEHCEFSHAVS